MKFSFLDMFLESSFLSWALVVTTFLSVVGVVMSRYLNGRAGEAKLNVERYFRQEILENFESLTKRIEVVENGISRNDDGENREKLIEEAYARLKNDSSDALLNELIEKYTAHQEKKELRMYVYEKTYKTISRLRAEISDLRLRGNLSLIIGSLSTILGFGILSYFVAGSSIIFDIEKVPSLEVFLINFIPRLSLVLIIEVFAYFFLRLYKDSHAEIKYFQNELSSLEMKFLALEIAVRSEIPESVKSIIESFSKLERNFIISKDQTTVDIERARIEQAESVNFVDKLSDIIRSKKDA